MIISDDKLKKLNIADLHRISNYSADLERGLEKIRTFPQGVTVFGSARIKEDSPYYQQARELGRLLANNGHAVVTGGGPGIMEAANRGAYEYGGRSIGLNIILAHEQHPNPFLTDNLDFKHFFARKVMLTMASKVYVFFPGGFGTMDEFTEVLELIKEEKMPKMPTFLFGTRFWRPIDRFYHKLADQKLIEPADLKLYKLTNDVNDIVKAANKIGHFKITDNVYDAFEH